MKYYLFDDTSPLVARRDGYNTPEIYLNGEWKKFPDIERFSLNIEEITEKEAMKEMAKSGYVSEGMKSTL